MERRVLMGRRRLCNKQRSADRTRWFTPDLVFAGFALSIFSVGLYLVSHRARPMGTESIRISLGKPCASRCERALGVASPDSFERAGGVARSSNFCSASGSGGISGMDHGAEKCSDGLFLS